MQLRLRVPRPENALHFNVSFVPDPSINLEVTSRIVYDNYDYTLFRDKLNGFLSKKLASIFREHWVLPTRRFFDLPLITYPGQHVRRQAFLLFLFSFAHAPLCMPSLCARAI